jgi:hypothetical protein
MARHPARALLLLTALAAIPARPLAPQAVRWKAHDFDRPRPPVVTPGATPGQPPSDAVVLFDGRSTDAWTAGGGRPAGWTVRDGYMETAPGTGPIRTRRGFGDVQLHLEWATPARAEGSGQGRGNSGVIFMERYEVQVLDSYRNETYADGQAAAIYGQYPPMANASRAPGEWQSYDIVFRRPRFGRDGALRSPARMTVFHNGVLVQDDVELWGPTDWLEHQPYAPHADTLPLLLQDHDNPVRYRNIWVRALPEQPRPGGLAETRAALTIPRAVLQGYVGTYGSADGMAARIILRGGQLHLLLSADATPRALVPLSRDRFALRRTAGRVEFVRGEGGRLRIRLAVAGVEREGDKLP